MTYIVNFKLILKRLVQLYQTGLVDPNIQRINELCNESIKIVERTNVVYIEFIKSN
jgi:hypothetical protein